MPPRIATGAPPATTRVAPEIQRPVEHGVRARVQLPTTYVVEIVTICFPETNTRGNDATGVAAPPCEQETVAPR
jgi:hypothetical protein